VLLAINRKIVKLFFVRLLMAAFLCTYFSSNAQACMGLKAKQDSRESEQHLTKHCHQSKSVHTDESTAPPIDSHVSFSSHDASGSNCASDCDGDCGNCHFFSPSITFTQPAFNYPRSSPVYHYHSSLQLIVISLNHPPPIYSPVR
jgi:hypothetical protein